jgi:hypothetical protein
MNHWFCLISSLPAENATARLFDRSEDYASLLAESVLAGLRQTLPDDDQYLTAASAVFNGLLVAFEQGEKTNEPARITPV